MIWTLNWIFWITGSAECAPEHISCDLVMLNVLILC